MYRPPVSLKIPINNDLRCGQCAAGPKAYERAAYYDADGLQQPAW